MNSAAWLCCHLAISQGKLNTIPATLAHKKKIVSVQRTEIDESHRTHWGMYCACAARRRSSLTQHVNSRGLAHRETLCRDRVELIR